MLWNAPGGFGKQCEALGSKALGCPQRPLEAMGGSGRLWEALGGCGLHWEALVRGGGLLTQMGKLGVPIISPSLSPFAKYSIS